MKGEREREIERQYSQDMIPGPQQYLLQILQLSGCNVSKTKRGCRHTLTWALCEEQWGEADPLGDRGAGGVRSAVLIYSGGMQQYHTVVSRWGHELN
jgi:hypothetical protein